jgi:hypothetical protein
MPNIEQSSQLQQFSAASAYREARTSWWPSAASFEWYLRRHRVRLVKAGALIMQRGAWLIHAGIFDAEAVAIAQSEAQAWVEREASKVAA